MNQIIRSGSSFLDARLMLKNKSPERRSMLKKAASAVVLSMSLFLIGSCNERATYLDFAKTKPDLTAMEKGDLLRYAYAIQAGLMNAPEDIQKLRTADIQLALANPDLERKDGQARVWQFRGASCVLDVHWQANKSKRVTHHEFRVRQVLAPQKITKNKMPEGWTCIQDIIQERRAEIEASFQETYAVLSLNAHKS